MQLLLTKGGRGIVKMQDSAGRLDDVIVSTLITKAIVSTQTKVLVASAAIIKREHLSGNDHLLFGPTG